MPVTSPKSERGRPSLERSGEITAQIVAAAGAMFLELGYERTSMEAVARVVGVPKTTLYKRFADKNALLRAAVAERMRQWASLSPPLCTLPDTLAGRLAHHVATIIVWATKPEVRAINKLIANLPETRGYEFGGRGFGGYQAMRDMLTGAILELGPAEGVTARDPERVTDALMALAAGWLLAQADEGAVGEDRAHDVAEWIVDLTINGAQAW